MQVPGQYLPVRLHLHHGPERQFRRTLQAEVSLHRHLSEWLPVPRHAERQPEVLLRDARSGRALLIRGAAVPARLDAGPGDARGLILRDFPARLYRSRQARMKTQA